jgi:inner membrane transporter RhtA
VLGGVFSVQIGAGLAKTLFDTLPPSAVVLVRLATSAVVLAMVARSALRAVLRHAGKIDLLVAVGFGLILALMNFSIYESFSRIPLGIAVMIEFLGPLGVSVAYSRHRVDVAWVALAAFGVVLLARGDTRELDPIGVAFALVAGACWAAYILLSAETGRRFSGTSGLAIASIVGTVAIAPVGIHAGGADLLRPDMLAIGVAIGLLSSVIPYSLELEALRRMPARVFGILMSLDPAVAALAGLVILGEVLQLREWAAIGCVVIACIGATYSSPQRPEVPEG